MANPKSITVTASNQTITIKKDDCALGEKLDASIALVTNGNDGPATNLSGMAGPNGTATLTYAALTHGTYHVQVTTHVAGQNAMTYDYSVNA